MKYLISLIILIYSQISLSNDLVVKDGDLINISGRIEDDSRYNYSDCGSICHLIYTSSRIISGDTSSKSIPLEPSDAVTKEEIIRNSLYEVDIKCLIEIPQKKLFQKQRGPYCKVVELKKQKSLESANEPILTSKTGKSLHITFQAWRQVWDKNKQICKDEGIRNQSEIIEKKCIANNKYWLNELSKQFDDEGLSINAWETCFRETYFPTTLSYESWVKCNRVAKTRPWLHD